MNIQYYGHSCFKISIKPKIQSQSQSQDSLLVLSYQAQLPFNDPRYDAKRVYVYLPDWIMNIQLNDWQSRSDIWTVWLLRKKK